MMTARRTATMTARRTATIAIFSGAAAAVLVVVAASGGGGAGPRDDGASGDGNWVWGLLLILAPLVCAGATRTVTASTLLRPVGGVATAVCLMASLLHVVFVVEQRGVTGWLYALPSIATPLLLLVAVLTGRENNASREPRSDGRRSDEPRSDGRRSDRRAADESSTQTAREDRRPHGPPLDVLTPLRDARAHAVVAVAAWFIVLAVAAVVAVPAFRLMGWPEVVTTVEAEVVSAEKIGDRTLVTFEGRRGGEVLRWSRSIDNSRWEPGDRREVFLDDRGRLHHSQQFGLAGIPLVMPLYLVGAFTMLSVRRLWGLVIASWDVRNGRDVPRLAYAAVIDDPAPRTYRPLLAVWEDDPSEAPRLPKPDAVYRGDAETSEHLECRSDDVVVRRAWIDTGPWRGSKPRWIGFDDGVAVPHRRSFCGRWYVHVVTKRSEVGEVVPLRHGPPEPWREPARPAEHHARHSVPVMVAWRLPVAFLGIALAFLQDSRGLAI